MILQKIKCIYILMIAVILGSCGFHLRGYSSLSNYKLPFKTVYIQCDNVAICSNLSSLITKQNLSTVVNKASDAEAVLRLSKEETSRDANGFNTAGRIASYLLTYQATIEVWQQGEQVGNDITIHAQATMNYNDSLILSKDQEEADIWDKLHQDAASQLVRRLIALKNRASNVN